MEAAFCVKFADRFQEDGLISHGCYYPAASDGDALLSRRIQLPLRPGRNKQFQHVHAT